MPKDLYDKLAKSSKILGQIIHVIDHTKPRGWTVTIKADSSHPYDIGFQDTIPAARNKGELRLKVSEPGGAYGKHTEYVLNKTTGQLTISTSYNSFGYDPDKPNVMSFPPTQISVYFPGGREYQVKLGKMLRLAVANQDRAISRVDRQLIGSFIRNVKRFFRIPAPRPEPYPIRPV